MSLPLSEVRERAERVLRTPAILLDGSPPRFERVGFYFDFSGRDDPSYSTEKEARYWAECFAEASRESPENAGDATDAAMRLAALRHFQFAGALDPRPFLAAAGELALAYLQAQARISRASEDSGCLQIRRLLHGLLLCALAGRWQTFKQICDAVRPRLMSADRAGEEADDYAQALLLFVSGYRDQALPKAAALEQAIQKRRSRRPRLLQDVCRAVGASREADLEESLRRSLEYFLEIRPEEKFIPTSRSNAPFRYVALPESLFHLAARDRGLNPAPLPPHLADLLMTPESVGCR